jgi:hypothetical protein
MATPRVETDEDLDMADRLDYERTRIRFAQRIAYRRHLKKAKEKILEEMQLGGLAKTFELEPGDE